ncbi:MAG: aldolase/citrate lyase family protein [Alphaproteobacteria bacterium]|jgi:4-hydroxy-2-oxoheptanedioate aldolase|nr:2,4-dihydroxyhept-2-ene-1,7-dioic acid aldolase [Rhodospirillaceae bacterium]MBT6512104.1 2,4-dihydroxyhept-2-ene-1,7-dioic acid aldolase [Rhodospirillaceae bacterium]MBT7614840.1 2,4-dihydroxyhept-2-ene-1,7-dioic acid aldolase [Rhodospirillaceae bacterium]MBT7648492.1 2,4-dihydroxyhept-2-ene-1,7-dioic acid aldolase [Rhodospirillaceae bacterium]MDG2482193.1 aldolase/citrate lyase family protein [Alphaproteobacteria bacterium]
MRENKLREIWANGGTVFNGWLASPSSVAAEVMARQDWDSVTIDLQHGLIDYSDAVPMFQAISQTDTVPLARAPWNEPIMVQKLLDAGAYGIICPMINSREEAERFVGACRYAPDGYRSVGPIRAAMYAGADYIPNANRTVVAFAMIETKQAMANLDEILTTPGLDAIFVGPSDLSVSMGTAAGFDPEFPEVMAAIELVAERCKVHGVVAGIHTGSVEYALRMQELGYQFITLLSELRMIQWATANAIKAFRDGAPADNAP